MANGVPAIVTADDGPATFVRNGETGRIVRDEDFAAAIAGVLADPAGKVQWPALHTDCRCSRRCR
jgi:glycosyltransferase involved in cell wall biosynthesis